MKKDEKNLTPGAKMAFFIAFINLSLGFAKYEKGKFSVPRELNETFDSLAHHVEQFKIRESLDKSRIF